MTIELDNNATTRPSDAVVEACVRVMRDSWHNPSSLHRGGQAARVEIEQARRSCADLLGVPPREITFTSGATEALTLGVRSVLRARPEESSRDVIVTTPVEHEAVRDLLDGLLSEGVIREVRTCTILPDGRIDPDSLTQVMDERVAMGVVQWANNETGAIQPVAAFAEAIHAVGGVVLCDATQWVGKMPTRLRTRSAADGMPLDLLACSAHIMHGPKGVGVLRHTRGVPFKTVTPGTQERERRGGTEAVPAIAGFGVACQEAAHWLADPAGRARGAQLRDRLESVIVDAFPGALVNGPVGDAERLWNTTSIAFPDLEAEAMLVRLSEVGVHASAGAACSSGSIEPSPVLGAMGLPERLARGSIRLSLSRDTTQDDVDEAAEKIIEAGRRLGQITV